MNNTDYVLIGIIIGFAICMVTLVITGVILI